MSLVKLSSMTIKSPFKWGVCSDNLCSGETYLGINKLKNYVHFFQKPDKGTIRHFTMAGPFGKLKPNSSFGSIKESPTEFYGAVHNFTNKDAKKKLSKFDEIYKFKTLDSAKRFREQLKEL